MKLISILFLATLFVLSCSVDKADEIPKPFVVEKGDSIIVKDSTKVSFCDTITFAKHVLPIFTSICANPSCHVTGGGGPFPLTKYTEIFDKTDLIIPAIEHTPGSRKMPYDPATFSPADKLPQDKIEAIKCWVAAGKPNN